MSLPATILLGAIAGFTIYLGLPMARLKSAPRFVQAFLNALATGILIFLLWDVISKASEPIDSALGPAKHGHPASFATLLTIFVLGFAIGLFSLVYFQRTYIRRAARSVQTQVAPPSQLALMIAVGIGMHNFSEGLAIGQAARSGAISLAMILIVGFAAHNMTEGFGIAAPFNSAGVLPSWRFLGLSGLIGGGPTFLGTLLGHVFRSDFLFVLFLALAAGSILFVVSELLTIGRRFALQEIAMTGVFVGFMLGYGTDLIVTWGGA